MRALPAGALPVSARTLETQVTLTEVSPEQFARFFHRYHEALAPEQSAQVHCEWQDLAEDERERMVAAARLAFLELEASPQNQAPHENPRRWFAKPGEAEWGC